MESMLISLATNKLFLGLVGGLGILLFTYLKGVSKGKASELAKQAEAEREQRERIHQAQKENLDANQKVKEKNAEITNSRDVSTIIRLLHEVLSGSGPKTK